MSRACNCTSIYVHLAPPRTQEQKAISAVAAVNNWAWVTTCKQVQRAIKLRHTLPAVRELQRRRSGTHRFLPWPIKSDWRSTDPNLDPGAVRARSRSPPIDARGACISFSKLDERFVFFFFLPSCVRVSIFIIYQAMIWLRALKSCVFFSLFRIAQSEMFWFSKGLWADFHPCARSRRW